MHDKQTNKSTGPNMVMQPGMRFSPSDWAKLTKAQKDKIYEFMKNKKNIHHLLPLLFIVLKLLQQPFLCHLSPQLLLLQILQLLQIVTSAIFFLIKRLENFHLYLLKS